MVAAANDSGSASRSAAVSSSVAGGTGAVKPRPERQSARRGTGEASTTSRSQRRSRGPGLGGDARGCGGRMEGAHGPPVALRPSTHAPRASPGSSSSRTSRLSACGAARSSGSSGEEHDATWSSVRTNAWRGAGRTEGQTGVAVRVQGEGEQLGSGTRCRPRGKKWRAPRRVAHRSDTALKPHRREWRPRATRSTPRSRPSARTRPSRAQDCPPFGTNRRLDARERGGVPRPSSSHIL